MKGDSSESTENRPLCAAFVPLKIIAAHSEFFLPFQTSCFEISDNQQDKENPQNQIPS